MSYAVPTTLASPADYIDWTQVSQTPDGILATLRACTTLVLEATKTAIYDADTTTGIATDATVRDALRDATCIQASAWVQLGINAATGGVIQTSKAVTSKKIGTATIDYSPAEVQATTQARQAAFSGLVPEAFTYLRTRGLISSAVWSA